MGLFSNSKKPCPLCGSPTPRLLATKVEDMPLCKECAGKIDLPDGALDRMTLAQLEQYMAFYEENAARDLQRGLPLRLRPPQRRPGGGQRPPPAAHQALR